MFVKLRAFLPMFVYIYCKLRVLIVVGKLYEVLHVKRKECNKNNIYIGGICFGKLVRSQQIRKYFL